MTTLPPSITPLNASRLVGIAKCARGGMSKAEALCWLNLNASQMNCTLNAVFGSALWPPPVTEAHLQLPVRMTRPGEASGHYASGAAQRGERLVGMSPEEIAERIERDQAAKRAERERWLTIEQQRYGLRRRGTLIDDMPA